MKDRLTPAYWALRLGLGTGMFLAGLDKFFDKLASWGMYLSPVAEHLLPVSAVTFMRSIGVLEMAIGILVLLGGARVGGYVLMLWLLGIAGNLLTTGMFYDLALRDVEGALAAFALAHLSAERAARASGSARAS